MKSICNDCFFNGNQDACRIAKLGVEGIIIKCVKYTKATNDSTAIKILTDKIKTKSTRCEHGGKCEHDPCVYRLAVEIDKILSRT